MTQATENLQRIEYQMSAGYVENWTLKEMLRELVANAADEKTIDPAVDFEVSFVPDGPDAKWGTAHINDSGRGFPREYLLVGSGEKKSGEQIGQFREGLKLALLVAAREDANIAVRTRGFCIEKAALEPGQLGEGLTIYVGPGWDNKGTSVTVRCKQSDFDAVQRMFIRYRFKGSTVKTVKARAGAVWVDPDTDNRGQVFVNGLLVQSFSIFCSYNLSGEEMKSAQNRDRMVLNWTDVRSAVGEHLRKLEDRKVMRQVAERIIDCVHRGCSKPDDLEQLYGVARHDDDLRAAWRNAFVKVISKHPIRNQKSELLKITVATTMADPEDVLAAQEQGFTVIRTDGNWHSLLADLFEPIKTALKNDADREDRRVDEVPWKEVTADEKRRLQRVMSTLQPYFKEKLPGVGVFTKSRVLENATGLWWKGKVWFRRDHLQSDDVPSMRKLTEIALHELCHWRSGGAKDRSRDFEHAIVGLAVDILMAHSEGRAIDDVDPRPAWLQSFDKAEHSYTWDDIRGRLNIGAPGSGQLPTVRMSKNTVRNLAKVDRWMRAEYGLSEYERENRHLRSRAYLEGEYFVGKANRAKDPYVVLHVRKAYLREKGRKTMTIREVFVTSWTVRGQSGSITHYTPSFSYYEMPLPEPVSTAMAAST